MFDERISILIPYKSDAGYRDRNFHWTKKRYELLLPNAEICVGYSNTNPFCKSSAVNKAAELATRDIFVIADIDIVCNLSQIAKSILALSKFPWIIPYSRINYLSLEETFKLHKMNPNIDINSIEFTNYSTPKSISGAINIVPRKYFEKVGGFDERFKGWGCEDDAFQMSLNSLYGPCGKINNTLWHMYHPPANRDNYTNNWALFNKFYKDKDTIIKYFNEKK